jgi:hypothetical protein
VLAAVLGSVLLATTLLAAGPVVATAVAEAGLAAELARAPASSIGVQVTARAEADRVAATVSELRSELVDVLGPAVAPADVTVTGPSVALVEAGDAAVAVPVARVLADGLLVDVAAAPRDVLSDAVAAGAVPVRLHREAADLLGLTPGDRLRTTEGVTAVLAGTVEPADLADPRWWADPTLRDGVLPGVDFTTVGPLIVEDLAGLGALTQRARVSVQARTLPDAAVVGPADLAELGRQVRALQRRVGLALAGTATQVRVSSGLVDATATTSGALTATRAAVVATTGQVAVLALYALGLAGRLLRSGRSVETELVRARGATPRQLGATALLEGVLLVVPAVLVAPLLASLLTAALGRLPLLTDAALVLRPRPGLSAWLAALVAGTACLVVLVAPAVSGARRTFAGVRAGVGRRDPAQVAQRYGLDLALVVVAVIGVWQLRRTGGPVARAADGSVGVDPVLVVAPALGLLAGALLVLRVVPRLAALGERVAGRSRTLVAGLGGWQVARRPDLVARPTLLLVLAVAVGVLGGTYGATWSRSQLDQAAAAIGVDVRVAPDQRPAGLAAERVGTALRATPGVAVAAPTWDGQVQFTTGGAVGRVLALDATRAPLRGRADLGPDVPLVRLEAPALAGLDLPLPPAGEAARLTVTARIPVDDVWPEAAVAVRPVLRDGDGAVHREVPVPAPRGVATVLEWDVSDHPRPVALLAWEVRADTADTTLVGERAAAAGLARLRGPDVVVALLAPSIVGAADTIPFDPTTAAWTVDPLPPGGALPAAVEEFAVDRAGWALRGTSGAGTARSRSVELRMLVPDPQTAPTVPGAVAPSVLAATGREVGDVVGIATGGVPIDVEVVGTVDVLPGATRVANAVVVDLDAISAARWRNGRLPTTPTGWQLGLDLPPGAGPAEELALARDVAASVAAAPVNAPVVDTLAEDGAARLRDPIAVGLLLALALGALTALVLAVLGTVSTAVAGVRERAGELALLQAVGTTIGQLRVALASEVAVVVVTGTVGGLALGSGLVWAVLPTIALAADGTPAVPAPVVAVPWVPLTLVLLGVVALLATVPVVLARAVSRQHVAEVLRLGDDG